MQKLSFTEKVGYGLGDTASNFIWATLSSFQLFFYTDIFGLSLATVGIVMTVTRVFDGFLDLAMGAIADRTNTRWGKFRPYLIWMSVPLAISFILAFTTPNLDSNGKFWYALITYNLLMLFYTAINIPYSALSGVMTDDPLDRTSLSSYRMVLAQAGGVLVNLTTLYLVSYFGGGTGRANFDWVHDIWAFPNLEQLVPHVDRQAGYRGTIIVFSIGAILLFAITFLTCRERIQPPKSQKTKVADDVKFLFGNWNWVIMFVTALANMIFSMARGNNVMFYCKRYLLWDDSQATFYLTLGSFGFIAGAFSARLFTHLFGKRTAFIVTMAVMGVSSLSNLWLPVSAAWLIYVMQVVFLFAVGVNAVMFWAIVADIADYSEWKFKTRSTGIVFSATVCAQKVGMGLAGAVSAFVLAKVGYDAHLTLTDEARQGVLALMSWIPAVGFLFIAVFFNLYTLTDKQLAVIRDDLTERRAAEAEGHATHGG